LGVNFATFQYNISLTGITRLEDVRRVFELRLALYIILFLTLLLTYNKLLYLIFENGTTLLIILRRST